MPRAMVSTFFTRVLLAVVVVAFHLGIFYAAGGRQLENFVRFDTGWYHCIVTNGYQTDDPPQRQSCSSNVAFYPGYPMTARALHLATGMPPFEALVAVSLAAAVVMWLYLFQIFHTLKIPRVLQVGGTLLLLSHPAAFFLVAGYSESLFLAALLGTMYFSLSSRPASLGAALLHGMAMTATRAVGVAFVPFMGLARFLPEWKARGLGAVMRDVWGWKELYLCAAMFLGMLSFYVYTWLEFGHFDLYFQTGKIGWDINPNYTAFFSDALVKLKKVTILDAGKMNKNVMPLTMFFFVVIAILEGRRIKKWGMSDEFLRVRLPAYLCSFFMYYLVFSARYEMWFESCLRYSLGWCAPLIVCLVSYGKEAMSGYSKRKGWTLACVAVTVIAASFYSQFRMAERFTQGKWVAALNGPAQRQLALAEDQGLSHRSFAQ